MKNPVKKAMDKLCRPSYIPHKRAIKTKEIDMENAQREIDSYAGGYYDQDSLNTLENEGQE